MTDVSGSWRQEYHAVDVSPSIEPTCEFERCASTIGLQLVATGDDVRQLCRKHAKVVLGVSS